MLGYIVPEKSELKVREYELYTGYYCGICKSIEKRYGQIPRMVLSYDAVFLALVVSSMEPYQEQICVERCPIHPIKKRCIVYNQKGIDYSADMMLLLAYFNILDDLQDERSLKALAGRLLLKISYKKLMKIYKNKGIMIEAKLKELYSLEKEQCPSLDRAAEPFAKLMEEVFAVDNTPEYGEKVKLLRHIGYHIGKWIYLIDAFDDIEENLESGSYNPLICQFSYDKEKESSKEFKDRIQDRVEFNLLYYLAELAKTWEQFKTDKNQGLLENIIYFGLLRKTEQILGKGNIEDAEPL